MQLQVILKIKIVVLSLVLLLSTNVFAIETANQNYKIDGSLASPRPATDTIEWVYGDPLTTTSPTNFAPEDRHDLRPVRADDDYAQVTRILRAAYSQPPAQWPKPHLRPGVAHVELGSVRPASFPENNPFTDAKAKLGQTLFFDGRLSGTGQMACASCHVAELGWGDGRARALGHGVNQLARNTPSLLNAGVQRELFWDGRAQSIERLVVEVLTNESEMRTTAEQLQAKLQAIEGYRALFKEAFGDETVTMGRVAQAIATHVRTIVSEPSAEFDRFLAGEHDRLSDSAIRGLHLFRTNAGCLNCHNGPILSDGEFHNIGLHYFGRKYEDLGRYIVTQKPEDVGRFRTPPLRNIARTAPYMHVGFFDLPGVINMYNAGGSRPRPRPEFENNPLWPETSDLLVPLHLNDRDKEDLTAFLESLTERRRRDLAPELPR